MLCQLRVVLSPRQPEKDGHSFNISETNFFLFLKLEKIKMPRNTGGTEQLKYPKRSLRGRECEGLILHIG